MITRSGWSGDDGRFPEHSIFVLNDPAYELKGLVAVVFLGRDQRLIEDQTHQIGCRRQLELGDELPGRTQAAFAFRFAADVGRLEREIDAAGRAVHLVRRQDLLAEQEACLGGKLYP